MAAYFQRLFFREIDASSLAVFRILFGALLLFEAVNYGVFLCLDCMYRETSLLFKYPGFDWAVLPPGKGLEILFAIMAIAGFCVMIGYRYRLAIIVVFLAFSYHFLLDRALYLNHYYLTMLFIGILIFLPANRCWSVDARRARPQQSETVPAWTRFWLCAQLEIVLLYAGIVKINSDWLQLEPMRLWMNARSADEGAFLQWVTQDWGIALASYSVIILHIIGAPLLLWKRTRFVVFLCYCVFHTINAFVFNIGIFPWMTIAATMLMFDPSWPRQMIKRINQRGYLQKFKSLASFEPEKARTENSTTLSSNSHSGVKTLWRTGIVTMVLVWLALQILVPLRHYRIPGDVNWTEQGHQFSWRMMLRSKRGNATFHVRTPKGGDYRVKLADHLTPKQTRKAACLPDLIWQFAQHLQSEALRQGHADDVAEVRIFVETSCSLNTREPERIINRLVDLTSIERGAPASTWITTLTKPLPNPIF